MQENQGFKNQIFPFVFSIYTFFDAAHSADRTAEILDNCASSVHLNSALFKHGAAAVCLREVDWGRGWPPTVEQCAL